MNKIKSIVVAGLGLTMGLASCDSGNIRRTPGHIYAPDMTYSRAYESYSYNPNFSDGITNRKPVAGTVARDLATPDHMTEGDTIGYKSFTTAMRFNAAEMKESGRLFNIYCAICHGPNLDGNGPLYSSGKFAAMPANFKDGKYIHMPVGQMYAALKYGKNMMGAYASQLDQKQRWMVIAYIKKMQAENGGDPFIFGEAGAKTDSMAKAPAAADSTKVAMNKMK